MTEPPKFDRTFKIVEGADLLLSRMDDLIAKHGSRNAVAVFFQISPGFITNVYNGVKPPPEWLLEHLGLERVKTTKVTYTIHEKPVDKSEIGLHIPE